MAKALDLSNDATMVVCFHDVTVEHMCSPLPAVSGPVFMARFAGHVGPHDDSRADLPPDAVIPDSEIVSVDLMMGRAQLAHLMAMLAAENVAQELCSRAAELPDSIGGTEITGSAAVDFLRNLLGFGDDGKGDRHA
jgi:hypothetical protein